MSDVSQIAPRVAMVARSRDAFAGWADFRDGLLGAGFTAEQSEEIGAQLELDWSRPQPRFSVLSALDRWVRFHNEFIACDGRRGAPRPRPRRDRRQQQQS